MPLWPSRAVSSPALPASNPDTRPSDPLRKDESCESTPSSQQQQRHHHQFHKKRPPSPVKLTPLEKKARDRERLREQARRRVARIRERDAQAVALAAAQTHSSQWHRQERLEEELVLRRLERDLVDPQRQHPASAGYRFFSASHAKSPETATPAFIGYAPARCPHQQHLAFHRRLGYRRPLLGSGAGGVLPPLTSVLHPSYLGFCVTSHGDASSLSPVFLMLGFEKIPLDEVDSSQDDDGDDRGNGQRRSLAQGSDSDSDGEQHARRRPVLVTPSVSERQAIRGLLQTRLRSKAEDQQASTSCSICQDRRALGCPGCFTFEHTRYEKTQAAAATLRLGTPKTHVQEQQEQLARHRALRMEVMGYGDGGHSIGGSSSNSVRWSVDGGHDYERLETAYYRAVLPDVHAIRKHRATTQNIVTLHIKTLPMGDLISLQVGEVASIAYVYELYRAHVRQPNRPIHLLLPTTTGLFTLDERLEQATDTRHGCVNGALLVQDFGLHSYRARRPLSSSSASSSPSSSSSSSRPEFLLLSVAVLSPHATPLLVAQYLGQNFQLETASLTLETSIVRLPHAVGDDDWQRRLVPHVQRMQYLAGVNRVLEQRELALQRERLVRAAYQEKLQAALLAQRQHQHQQQEQEDPKPSRKVVRAQSYLEMLLDRRHQQQHHHDPHGGRDENAAMLASLWQFFQRLHEWRLCKHGRLLDAESSRTTRALMQRHADATVATFDALLGRSAGAGPLPYAVYCLGPSSSPSSRKWVLHLGTRLGCSPQDDREYGLVLELQAYDCDEKRGQAEGQDHERMEAAGKPGYESSQQQLQALERTGGSTTPTPKKKRAVGVTKRELAERAQEQAEQQALAHSWRCADYEWRLPSSSSSAAPASTSSSPLLPSLTTGKDLLRVPFFEVPWHALALAYADALTSVAFQAAQLESYNALARVLQQEDAVLGKAQLQRWRDDAQRFHVALTALTDNSSPQLRGSCLVRASERVLQRKGASVLQQRRRQRRARQQAMAQERERMLAEMDATRVPRESVVQQLKQRFQRERAAGVRDAALGHTPSELLAATASRALGQVLARATRAADAAQKEYRVRAL